MTVVVGAPELIRLATNRYVLISTTRPVFPKVKSPHEKPRSRLLIDAAWTAEETSIEGFLRRIFATAGVGQGNPRYTFPQSKLRSIRRERASRGTFNLGTLDEWC